jgi:hypothetical protein
MALIGYERNFLIKTKTQKEEIIKALDKEIDDLIRLKGFADDFKEGRINRKEMKQKLKNMEDVSFFDKTKAKMFVNMSGYVHKIKDSKWTKRIPLLQKVMDIIDGFMGLSITYTVEGMSHDIYIISVTTISIGAERVNFKAHFSKMFSRHNINDYEIEEIKKESE